MFDEITMFMDEAVRAYDIENHKIEAVSNANDREFNLNKHKIELKIMQENGTIDDYYYLMAEAADTFGDKALAVLRKIKDAFLAFIAAIRDKIKELIDRIKESKIMTGISAKLKSLPFVGKKKVLVPNIDEQNKVYNETMGKLDVLASKAAAGQDVSKEDVDALMKKYKKRKIAAVGIAAASAVTIAGAVAIAKSTQGKAYGDLNTVQKRFVDIHDTIMKGISKIKKGKKDVSTDEKLNKMTSNAAVSKAVVNAAEEIGRDRATSVLENIKNIAKAIKGAIGNAGSKVTDFVKGKGKGSTNESFEDVYVDESIFVEAEEEEIIDIEDDPIEGDPDEDLMDITSDDEDDDDDDEDEDEKCGEGCKESTEVEDSLDDDEYLDKLFEASYAEIVNKDNTSDSLKDTKPTNPSILGDLYAGKEGSPLQGDAVSPKFAEIMNRLRAEV